MNDDLEQQLRDLDEAFRWSAKAHGWRESETSAEGLLPEEEIQPTGDIFHDLELDELPADVRFIGWVDAVATETEIVVSAEGEAKRFPREVWLEWSRRHLVAAGRMPGPLGPPEG